MFRPTLAIIRFSSERVLVLYKIYVYVYWTVHLLDS